MCYGNRKASIDHRCYHYEKTAFRFERRLKDRRHFLLYSYLIETKQKLIHYVQGNIAHIFHMFYDTVLQFIQCQ